MGLNGISWAEMVSTGDILGQNWAGLGKTAFVHALFYIKKPVDKFVGDYHFADGGFWRPACHRGGAGGHRIAPARGRQRESAARVAGPGATPSTASGSPAPGASAGG